MNQRNIAPGVLLLTPKPKRFWSGVTIEFERSPDNHIHLSRSGWYTWLDNFLDELVANKSFAEVFERNPSKVTKSLAALPSYNLYPKAVELPGRYINVRGMQDVVIQIDWRHYSNKEIGQEMTRWAAKNRPESEPEPDRTGKKRESKVHADLKALSVMRIWKHERHPWKRLKLVSKVCGYKAFENELAKYNQRCEGGRGDKPMGKSAQAEMTRARVRALSFFQSLFPWGKPANY